MTATFYLKVDIKTKEELEFEEDDYGDTGNPTPATPKINKQFNKRLEEEIKKTLMENADYFSTLIDEDENLTTEIQQAREEAASDFFDAETDLTTVTELMTEDITFTIVRKPLRSRKAKKK